MMTSPEMVQFIQDFTKIIFRLSYSYEAKQQTRDQKMFNSILDSFYQFWNCVGKNCVKHPLSLMS